MKKLFTKCCLLAIAMIMGGAISANAAEVTTLYEKGTTGKAWADTDLADWTTQWNTLTVDGGLYSKAKNAGWTSTKSIATTKNSIVTFTATLYGGQAPGRSGSYDYIKVGGVSLRLNGQDQKATVDIDGVSTTLSGFTRGGDYTITATINQATGAVSYEVSGKATGSGNGTTNTTVADVVFGHNRAGSEGYEIITILKSISISEEKQAVTTADYTINYKFDGNTINTVNGNTAVNNTVNAESPITIEGQKYYATSGTSLTVTSDAANNVLNVTLRKANDWNWTVKSSINTTLATGVCTEGENFTAALPRYVLSDGTLYETAKGSDWYHKTYAINQADQVETVTYNATSIADVVYYAEAEDLAGATAGNGNGSRTSKGLTAYGTNLPVTTLAPGKYKIMMHGANANSAARAVSFKDGEVALVEFTIAGNNNNQDFTSEEFSIANNTALTLTSEGSQASGVDYFYIVKTGDASIDASISSVGYSTFSAAFPTTIPADVTAYTVSVKDASTVTLTEIEDGVIPANTGVIIKGDAGSYSFVQSATAGTAESTLTAVLTETEISEDDYVLGNGDNGVGFYHLTAGNKVGANKAYLTLPAGAKFVGLFEDNTTAVAGVAEAKAEAKVVKFMKNGQLLIQTANGIINAAAAQVK